MKKGSYPYEYISDFEKFKEEFPRKEKFCNLLTDKTNSDKEYEHFLKVWNTFQMKKMKYYPDLYLKFDVLFLCDLFGKFRNSRLKICGLCLYYLSTPAISWDTMLMLICIYSLNEV